MTTLTKNSILTISSMPLHKEENINEFSELEKGLVKCGGGYSAKRGWSLGIHVHVRDLGLKWKI